MKQLNTVSAYLKSCTLPRSSLWENAMNLLSINPTGKLTRKLRIDDATCGLKVWEDIVMLSSKKIK